MLEIMHQNSTGFTKISLLRYIDFIGYTSRGNRVVLRAAAILRGQDLRLVRYQRLCVIRTQSDPEKKQTEN